MVTVYLGRMNRVIVGEPTALSYLGIGATALKLLWHVCDKDQPIRNSSEAGPKWLKCHKTEKIRYFEWLVRFKCPFLPNRARSQSDVSSLFSIVTGTMRGTVLVSIHIPISPSTFACFLSRRQQKTEKTCPPIYALNQSKNSGVK
jgi:hypothetical protein